MVKQKEYICQRCGERFMTKRRNLGYIPQFCSRSCADKAKRKIVVLVCEVCGGSFELCPSKAKDRRYCSRACSGIGRRGPRGRITLYCEKCGKSVEVLPSKTGRKFCSRECYRLASQNSIRVKCLRCGKQFETVPSKLAKGYSKFCSRECTIGYAWVGRVCEYCGQKFQRKRSKIREKPCKYCSQQCFRDARQAKKIQLVCETCGQIFQKLASQAKHKKRYFCSSECFKSRKSIAQSREETLRKAREYARSKYPANREYHRTYYEDHKGKISEQVRKWHKKHPEYRREWHRKNYQSKPRILSDYHDLSILDPAEYRRRWKAEHPNYGRDWARKNPEQVRLFSYRRRIRKMNAPGKHSLAQWRALLRENPICPGCRRKFSPLLPPTVDHIIPLSKGGSDFISNIQPLCKRCNSRKHVRILDLRSGDKFLREGRKYENDKLADGPP